MVLATKKKNTKQRNETKPEDLFFNGCRRECQQCKNGGEHGSSKRPAPNFLDNIDQR